jgi:hypothetical protein
MAALRQEVQSTGQSYDDLVAKEKQVAENISRNATLYEQAMARQSQALLDQKAAAEEAARGQAGLIESMQDATQEMFNQQVLAAIDPAEIGLEAWSQLGQELGLLTAEQVALGEAAQLAIDAFRSGNVDIQNAAEFTGALFEEAQKVNPQLQQIAENHESIASKVENAMTQLDPLINTHLKPLGETVGPQAAGAIAGIGTAAGNSVGPLGRAAGALRDYVAAARTVASIPSGLPGYQSGGIVPGPTGAPQLAIVHGGEQIIPVGGTTNNTTHNIGGVNNPLAAAILAANDMRRRFDDLNARMGTR